LIGISLDAGINLFDTADIYSDGLAEEILGKAIDGQAQRSADFDEGNLRHRQGPNDLDRRGYHLITACEKACGAWPRTTSTSTICTALMRSRRWKSCLSTLDDLVQSGKVRYNRVLKLLGWHLNEIPSNFRAIWLAKYVGIRCNTR